MRIEDKKFQLDLERFHVMQMQCATGTLFTISEVQIMIGDPVNRIIADAYALRLAGIVKKVPTTLIHLRC